jgi:hypothetical protein
MTKRDTDTENRTNGSTNDEDKEPAGHNFSADYESDYTVPALVKQNQRIESGLMSPHDIPESMPVLRAFHEFLDQERRHTQRRMIILAGVCIGLVAVVILCGVLLVANYGTSTRYQYKLMEHDLSDVREDASRARTTAESSANKYADKTDKLKDMIVNSQQQLATVQTRATTTAEQQQRDIEALRRQIELLQASRSLAAQGTAESDAYRKRQDDLVRELEKTRAELLLAKAASERPVPPVQPPPPEPMRVEPLPVIPPPVAIAPVVVTPVSTASTSTATTVQMPLLPQGSERPVPWRMPVPSR